MRICIIGKYPPIQGGVSTRTYLAAHALAQRGHEVHVVTNAKEAVPPFRMHMRESRFAASRRMRCVSRTVSPIAYSPSRSSDGPRWADTTRQARARNNEAGANAPGLFAG